MWLSCVLFFNMQQFYKQIEKVDASFKCFTNTTTKHEASCNRTSVISPLSQGSANTQRPFRKLLWSYILHRGKI